MKNIDFEKLDAINQRNLKEKVSGLRYEREFLERLISDEDNSKTIN